MKGEIVSETDSAVFRILERMTHHLWVLINSICRGFFLKNISSYHMTETHPVVITVLMVGRILSLRGTRVFISRHFLPEPGQINDKSEIQGLTFAVLPLAPLDFSVTLNPVCSLLVHPDSNFSTQTLALPTVVRAFKSCRCNADLCEHASRENKWYSNQSGPV